MTSSEPKTPTYINVKQNCPQKRVSTCKSVKVKNTHRNPQDTHIQPVMSTRRSSPVEHPVFMATLICIIHVKKKTRLHAFSSQFSSCTSAQTSPNSTHNPRPNPDPNPNPNPNPLGGSRSAKAVPRLRRVFRRRFPNNNRPVERQRPQTYHTDSVFSHFFSRR